MNIIQLFQSTNDKVFFSLSDQHQEARHWILSNFLTFMNCIYSAEKLIPHTRIATRRSNLHFSIHAYCAIFIFEQVHNVRQHSEEHLDCPSPEQMFEKFDFNNDSRINETEFTEMLPELVSGDQPCLLFFFFFKLSLPKAY